MEKGAFNTTFMTGDEYTDVARQGRRARTATLMKEAGFLAK